MMLKTMMLKTMMLKTMMIKGISSRQVLAAAGNSLPILSIIMRRNKNYPHHHRHPHFHRNRIF